jgi:hypothetical protein
MFRIAMTIGVKDDVECIDHNIRHHLSLGFDKLYILDLHSTDGTRAVLESWRGHPKVEIIFIDEHVVDTVKAHQVLRQRVYADSHLTHVLHIDPDEFLLLPKGLSIQDTMAALPADVYYIVRMNMMLTPLVVDGIQQRTIDRLGNAVFHYPRPPSRQLGPLDDPSGEATLDSLQVWLEGKPFPKVMHRLSEVRINYGGHLVNGPGLGLPHVPGNMCLVHMPVTSYSRFLRKVKNIQVCLRESPEKYPTGIATHWQHWDRALSTGRLEEVYQRALMKTEPLLSALRERRVQLFSSLVARDHNVLEAHPPVPQDSSYTLSPQLRTAAH